MRPNANETLTIVSSLTNGAAHVLPASAHGNARCSPTGRGITQHEDDEHVASAWLDQDQGGAHANAPAMPAQGAAGYAAAMRKMKKRQNAAFTILFNHQADERIKDMMVVLPEARCGAAAWALLERECGQGSSDLDMAPSTLSLATS